jgi:hypothetical protein
VEAAYLNAVLNCGVVEFQWKSGAGLDMEGVWVVKVSEEEEGEEDS